MTTYESASDDLVASVDRVAVGWLERVGLQCASRRFDPVPDDLRAALSAAAVEGHDWVVGALREVLGTDVDAQRANPLHILRQAVRFITEVLRSVGVPPVVRDEFDVTINPGDDYGLSPAHWSDVDESLTEPGIVWGAAKAATVLQRRRAEGKLGES